MTPPLDLVLALSARFARLHPDPVGNLLARSALILALVLAPISQVYAQLVTRVVDGDTLIVQGVWRVTWLQARSSHNVSSGDTRIYRLCQIFSVVVSGHQGAALQDSCHELWSRDTRYRQGAGRWDY